MTYSHLQIDVHDFHKYCPVFRSPTPLVHLHLKFFHPLDFGRSILNKSLLQIITKSIKRKHNLRMTIKCYQVLFQVGFRFQFQLINLVWLSFDFFSFSWSLTICFFVALYSCVCSCPKYHKMSFIYIIHIFSTLFTINLFYSCNLETNVSKIWNINRTVYVNEQNQNKSKTKHVILKLTTRSIVRLSPQTMQWYH